MNKDNVIKNKFNQNFNEKMCFVSDERYKLIIKKAILQIKQNNKSLRGYIIAM